MNEKNYFSLYKKAHKELFYYVNLFSEINDKKLKENYEIINDQISLFPIYNKKEETILDNNLKLIINNIGKEIKNYILITFNYFHGNITNINSMIMSKGFRYYYAENWNDYIQVEYEIPNTPVKEEIEVADNTINLAHKPNLERIKKIKEKRKDN